MALCSRTPTPSRCSAATPRRTGTATWRFRAETVRDASWAASAAFILDAATAAVEQADGSTNDVLILSAYPHEGLGTPDAPGWEEATRYGRASGVVMEHRMRINPEVGPQVLGVEVGEPREAV